MSWYYWLLLAVTCLVIESFISQFILIWFGISSFLAAIASYFHYSTTIQISICLVIGLLLLILFRTKLAKNIHKNITPTNADMLIGQTAIVSSDNNEHLRVTIDGIDWKAKATAPLQLHQKVKIKKIDGVTLIVEPLED